jgi:hypothetical protein
MGLLGNLGEDRYCLACDAVVKYEKVIDCGITSNYNYLIATPSSSHLMRLGTPLGRPCVAWISHCEER